MHPQSNLTRALATGLLVVLAIGVVWAALAGMAGYTLGSGPGLDSTASCYRIVRVLFIVPMWKAADPSTCGQPSSSAPAPAPATSSSAPATAPAAPICDDPHAATDGNTSGEASCSTPAPNCPAGFAVSNFGNCIDERHQPCPPGYTGWQNSQLDNCMEKPSSY